MEKLDAAIWRATARENTLNGTVRGNFTAIFRHTAHSSFSFFLLPGTSFFAMLIEK
jgi:hypothetical protein